MFSSRSPLDPSENGDFGSSREAKRRQAAPRLRQALFGSPSGSARITIGWSVTCVDEAIGEAPGMGVEMSKQCWQGAPAQKRRIPQTNKLKF
jgi:hypothetical protein